MRKSMSDCCEFLHPIIKECLRNTKHLDTVHYTIKHFDKKMTPIPAVAVIRLIDAGQLVPIDQAKRPQKLTKPQRKNMSKKVDDNKRISTSELGEMIYVQLLATF